MKNALFLAVLGAVVAFLLCGCSSIPTLSSPPAQTLVSDSVSAEAWYSLLTVQPLPENPDDSLMVSVQLGSLRRALNVTNTFDQFVILWPRVVGYILEEQEYAEELKLLLLEQERALKWNYGWLIIGAGVSGAVVGLVAGLIL